MYVNIDKDCRIFLSGFLCEEIYVYLDKIIFWLNKIINFFFGDL